MGTRPSGFNFEYDILPLGDYETVPVSSRLAPSPENYVEAVRLHIPVDAARLREEYLRFEKSGDYFLSRKHQFKNGLRETIQVFEDIGFSRESYQAWPIRKKGTNVLQDQVGPYTHSLLTSIGVELFRQQYVVAKKNWKTKLHIDHPDFRVHGFRMFVPIDPAYIGFEKNIYRLDPGDCYFVNIARPHRGFTDQDERVVIMAQMNSDELILGGTPMTPLDPSSLPEDFLVPL